MNEIEVLIGLSNPKSPTNVGAVMRAAGCFQADAVFYTGERYKRAMRFNTDTQNASREIALFDVGCLIEQAKYGVKVVCVELVEGATSLPEFKHPDKALYIFGPEDGSLSQDVVDKADAVVYVPSKGCLNLAATVNVVLYDRLAKSEHESGDELICESRDTNNRVKV